MTTSVESSCRLVPIGTDCSLLNHKQRSAPQHKQQRMKVPGSVELIKGCLVLFMDVWQLCLVFIANEWDVLNNTIQAVSIQNNVFSLDL